MGGPLLVNQSGRAETSRGLCEAHPHAMTNDIKQVPVTDIISGHAATVACTHVDFAGKGINLVGNCFKDEAGLE